MNEEIAKQLGFDSAAEFHKMVAAVDLTTADRFSAFVHWQQSDGTKQGLARLAINRGGDNGEAK